MKLTTTIVLLGTVACAQPTNFLGQEFTQYDGTLLGNPRAMDPARWSVVISGPPTNRITELTDTIAKLQKKIKWLEEQIDRLDDRFKSSSLVDLIRICTAEMRYAEWKGDKEREHYWRTMREQHIAELDKFYEDKKKKEKP